MKKPGALNEVVNKFYYEEDRYTLPRGKKAQKELSDSLKTYFTELIGDKLTCTIDKAEAKNLLLPDYIILTIEGSLKPTDYSAISSIMVGVKGITQALKENAPNYRHLTLDYGWVRLIHPNKKEHIAFNLEGAVSIDGDGSSIEPADLRDAAPKGIKYLTDSELYATIKEYVGSKEVALELNVVLWYH